ncbi:MAG: agmatinase [Deferribacteres bacterium]|nr:agmatinase [candidate division KSB1 bacterium]MCB9500381.1 agmatinase [Deferribacteres bacterium]
MHTLKQDKNFLGLPEDLSDFDKARGLVWPIAHEATTSYAKGTANGPAAILEASHQVEFWDDELDLEPCQTGIATLPIFSMDDRSHQEALDAMQKKANELFAGDKFVLSLGGEHSVTIPLVKAAVERFDNLSVLQLDAHSDLRDSYEGSPLNHACVMARVNEMCPFVSVGLRSGIRREGENIRSDAQLFYAGKIQGTHDWMQKAIDGLTENVYITFDLDFLDPSIMPSVGTPEPGGFYWYETLQFLRMVFQQRTVVAADIVELMPIPGLQTSDFLAAKLGYKMFGYKFFHLSA